MEKNNSRWNNAVTSKAETSKILMFGGENTTSDQDQDIQLPNLNSSNNHSLKKSPYNSKK